MDLDLILTNGGEELISTGFGEIWVQRLGVAIVRKNTYNERKTEGPQKELGLSRRDCCS